MNGFLTQLHHSFSVTGPIFIMLGLGVALKRWALIDDKFIEGGSRLVFTVTLPALLFLSVVKADLQQIGNINLLLFALIANTLIYVLFELFAQKLIKNKNETGVVVQGAFRANTGIIGLAYVSNAYGETGLVIGSLYVAVITVLYNILAVITLSRSSPDTQSLSISNLLRSIVKNPLIISICSAIPISLLEVDLPAVLLQSGSYFADMTLPLALLCTGASLDMKQLRQDSSNANYSTCGRLIIAPGMITAAGYLLGYRDIELGIIFLMSAAPTAAASYVMANAMGANAKLAANVIAMTTIGSLFTCSLGITLLSHSGLLGTLGTLG
ncbi:AEC family transporter [Photobacterium sp. OFAV2-7]|uniref:AEC family transporter n=1 Tax=Photobacterium sp. OFAV2-7 TaxID=2917748 RepID=UPI001EF6007A|nr:AEC family transporter [Photobacterium sp. OFAV2-7]MCG7587899.1 AEC family transporter [Photobacterium sp. OFAV2-7]